MFCWKEGKQKKTFWKNSCNLHSKMRRKCEQSTDWGSATSPTSIFSQAETESSRDMWGCVEYLNISKYLNI